MTDYFFINLIMTYSKMSHLARFVYRNYRGEIEIRVIKPLSWRFGTSEYYKKPVLLLEGICQDKNKVREFAISNILRWI